MTQKYIIYIFTNSLLDLWWLPFFASTGYCLFLLLLFWQSGEWWVCLLSRCSLIFICLITPEIDHIFTCLLTILSSSFAKCLFKFLLFFDQVFFIYLWECPIHSGYNLLFLYMFQVLCGLSFHLLHFIWSTEVSNFSISFVNLSFMDIAFWDLFKMSFSNLKVKRYSLI